MSNAYLLYKIAKDEAASSKRLERNNKAKNLARLALYGGGGTLAGGLIGGATNGFENWNNAAWGAGIGGLAGLGLGDYLNGVAEDVDKYGPSSMFDEIAKLNGKAATLAIGMGAAGAGVGAGAGHGYNKWRQARAAKKLQGYKKLRELVKLKKLTRKHKATGAIGSLATMLLLLAAGKYE